MADNSGSPHLERPSAAAGRAKRLLRIDPRTARRRIRNYVEDRPGPKLEGFIERGEDRDGYHFYIDTIGGRASSSSGPTDELWRLRVELAEALEANGRLESRAIEAEAHYAAAAGMCRQLLAVQETLLDAGKCFTDAAKCLANGAEAYSRALQIYGDLLLPVRTCNFPC